MIAGNTLETKVKTLELTVAESKYAEIFQGIDPVVETLYIQSNNLDDLLTRPRVAIVGSRKITPYGRAITEQFAGELARQGIVIVSGLAYGVDAVAHRAALDAGGLAIAVLPSSLQRVYPSAHTSLAQRIVEQGGALISEYPAGSDIAYKNQFIERNRIVCGISNVLLITEAAVNSGTMHTATYALGQGKDVLAIPGNITSPTSVGTNNLIKTGAGAATTPDDVLHLLSLAPLEDKPPARGSSADEQCIIDLLVDNITDGGELVRRSGLEIAQFNHALTMLELTGKIRSVGSNQWSLH